MRVKGDPADFGRCYRLLNLFPAWKERLAEVAVRFPEWRGLIANWAELTGLYFEEEGVLVVSLHVPMLILVLEIKHPPMTMLPEGGAA